MGAIHHNTTSKMEHQSTARIPVGVQASGMTALLMSGLPVTRVSTTTEVSATPPAQSPLVMGVLPARTSSASCRSIEDVTLADVVVGDELYEHEGVSSTRKTVVSIKDIYCGGIRHAELRAICTVLAVPGYKNKKKATMAHLIALKKLNEEVYDNLFSSPSKKPKAPNQQAQCPFRLLNILFSDTFTERFSRLGDSSTRQELDGRVSKRTAFWSDVRDDFLDTTDVHIGKLQFSHFALDEIDIDLSIVVPHG